MPDDISRLPVLDRAYDPISDHAIAMDTVRLAIILGETDFLESAFAILLRHLSDVEDAQVNRDRRGRIMFRFFLRYVTFVSDVTHGSHICNIFCVTSDVKYVICEIYVPK